MADANARTVLPHLAEPVVDRLRQVAAALDAPAADFDGLVTALFADLGDVAGAVGVDPRPPGRAAA